MSAAILGAGINGLSVAHKIRGANIPYKIFEKSSHPGGVIRTVKLFGVNNPNIYSLVECGPHSIRNKGVDILNICKDLDLTSKIIWAPPKFPKFVVREGKLVSFSLRNNFKIYWKEILSSFFLMWYHNEELSNCTIANFCKNYLSSDFGEKVIAPMIMGIYGGNIHKLTLHSLFPFLKNREIDTRGLSYTIIGILFKLTFSKFIPKGLKINSYTFENGLQTLTDALAEESRSSMMLNHNVLGLELNSKDKSWIVHTDKGDYEFNSIVSALKPLALAPIIRPFSKEAYDLLMNMEYVDIATVSVIFDSNSVVDKKYHGFGLLISPEERRPCMGIFFDSIVFPELSSPNTTNITVFIGGDSSNHPDVPNIKLLSDEELLQIAISEIRSLLNIKADPANYHVFKNMSCITQWTPGYFEKSKRIRQLFKEIPGFYASSFDEVSINDCVETAVNSSVQTSKYLDSLKI